MFFRWASSSPASAWPSLGVILPAPTASRTTPIAATTPAGVSIFGSSRERRRSRDGRNEPVDYEAQCRSVAGLGHLYSLSGNLLALLIEERLKGNSGLVAAALGPPLAEVVATGSRRRRKSRRSAGPRLGYRHGAKKPIPVNSRVLQCALVAPSVLVPLSRELRHSLTPVPRILLLTMLHTASLCNAPASSASALRLRGAT